MKKFKTARLVRSKNWNRWYIVYSIWNDEKEKLIERREYIVSNYESVFEREKFFKKRKKEIDRRLRLESVLNTKSGFLSIEKAFNDILDIKSVTMRKESFDSYKSELSIFFLFARHEGIIDKDILKLSKRHVVSFSDYLLIKRKVGTVTRNGYLTALAAMCSEMLKRDIIKENPFEKFERLKEEKSTKNRALKDNEIELMLMEIKKDLTLWLQVQLLYYCFIRPKECRNLKIADIDLKSDKIYCRSSWSKNRKNETVTIPPVFSIFLKKYIKEIQKQDLYLIGIKGEPSINKIGRNTLTNRHREIRNRLNLDSDITLYSWKHTGNVKAFLNGVHLKALQRQNRHHSIEQTDNYLKSLGLYENTEIALKMPPIE